MQHLASMLEAQGGPDKTEGNQSGGRWENVSDWDESGVTGGSQTGDVWWCDEIFIPGLAWAPAGSCYFAINQSDLSDIAAAHP